MLALVATPIGNLGDITLRALEVLKKADLIAAEDTRHSSLLLRHYEIRKPLLSYHEHNEARRTVEILERLKAGDYVVVITDAGMPSISDPGLRLLRACQLEGIDYTVLPGPSSVVTALVGSGFPTDAFYFGGFLPPKSGGRERTLMEAGERAETSIFFESPRRLVRTLEALARLLPDREVCVARELTKRFEEYRRGTGAELAAHFAQIPPKGEIVLLLKPLTKKERREITERSFLE